ncbi:MAG: hypothetical protein GY873_09990 [Bosea sp.]|uniref:hypothetical protein n=1 Tax=Bosea sp. (in: a-proteobacteria) TaxID=1871050 RepID=UPI00239324C9|nr:hypothetical protein [Bosea sp. (in: a-proteobacteria)]MCP4734508.1 hypothetical protein [Bosea sp. (in: a-proteobacteria)]
MTTIRQINKLVAPLISASGPLVQKAGTLTLRPLHHVVNQLIVWRTSEADHFEVNWRCCPSFSEKFAAGWDVTFLQAPRQLWRWSTSGVHEIFITRVNDEILPRMRAAQTIDGFVQHVSEPEFSARRLIDHVDTDIRVDIARGDLDTARMKCRALHERCARDPESYWGRIWRRTTDRAGPLLEADDRPALASLLYEWERELIKERGLEAIYEPTPFPLELSAGA